MKKIRRIKAARGIAMVASLKLEMQRPRLTESVREGLAAEAASALKEPVAPLSVRA
jgi:hypothetical protein